MIEVQIAQHKNLRDEYRTIYILETNRVVYKHVEATRIILAVLGDYKARYNGYSGCSLYPSLAKIDKLAEEISLVSIYEITSTCWELFYA